VRPSNEEFEMINRKALIPFIVIMLACFCAQPVCWAGSFVSQDNVDLLKLLPPPPPEKSAQAQAEISELIQIQKTRTQAEETQAVSDNKLNVFQFGGDVFGPKFKPENLPLTAKFFERLGEDAIAVFNGPKEHWHRARPFKASAEIKPCVEPPSSGSYPSGHSTFGYLCAVVLSNMVPEKKAEIFARAGQYARNRMVCGVHYRSDIEEGQVSGTLVAAFAMQNPNFKKDFNKVKEEIRKALGL
jgi:acid phosphatase (class A)